MAFFVAALTLWLYSGMTKNERVGSRNDFGPALGVFVKVLARSGIFRFVVHWQIHGKEVHEFDLKAPVRFGQIVKPLSYWSADATRSSAANDDLKNWF
jgi:hypothetical protein